MKPGDKVRFLRTSGEGRIIKVNKDNTIDVEIEDGFVIPTLKSELVLIAALEGEIFKKTVDADESPNTTKGEIKASTKGFALVFSAFNESILRVEIVNNTNLEILFAAFEENAKERITGIARDILKPGKSLKIAERKLNDLKNWPPLLLHVLFFDFAEYFPTKPIQKRFLFSVASFFKHKKVHPLTGKEAFVFEIEPEIKDLIPEDFAIGKAVKEIEIISLEKPNNEIDLHIEKLTTNFAKMKPDEMLQMQFDMFEKTLQNALASGMHEITFIHGVGSGILKNKIHKYLSSNTTIAFFKDAQKEKFGYGATYVKFK